MNLKRLFFLILVIFIFGCHSSEDMLLEEASLDEEIMSQLEGKIVFQSDRDGNWNIFEIDLESKDLVRLTDNRADDEYPVYSPEGQKIAFKSNRTGKWQVFLMDRNGSNQEQLTLSDFPNYDPAWFPDGRRIAFTSDRGEGERIYLIDIDTREEKLLVEVNFRSGLSSFSPNGKHLLFTGNELGWNVYRVDLNSKVVERITSRGGACRPDWSPDGGTVAYVSNRSDNIGDIWLMNKEGGNQIRLTFTAELSDYYPAWSPDGKWIAYASSPNGREGNWDLYVISASGEDRCRLTFDKSKNKFPDWSK